MLQACDVVMWRMVRRYVPHAVVGTLVLLLLYRGHYTCETAPHRAHRQVKRECLVAGALTAYTWSALLLFGDLRFLFRVFYCWVDSVFCSFFFSCSSMLFLWVYHYCIIFLFNFLCYHHCYGLLHFHINFHFHIVIFFSTSWLFTILFSLLIILFACVHSFIFHHLK